MYARVASFEGGDNERLRQMAEERRGSGSMMPAGMKRGMVLHDSDANRRLFISFFDSRPDVQAAEAQFDQMGDEIPEEVRGRRTSVDVYEVVWDEEV
jgi:hypothetical protein